MPTSATASSDLHNGGRSASCARKWNILKPFSQSWPHVKCCRGHYILTNALFSLKRNFSRTIFCLNRCVIRICVQSSFYRQCGSISTYQFLLIWEKSKLTNFDQFGQLCNCVTKRSKIIYSIDASLREKSHSLFRVSMVILSRVIHINVKVTCGDLEFTFNYQVTR